jgi:hypothetical protein
MRLPKAIAQYVKGQNARDVAAILACFSKNAFVHDEGQDYRGEDKIKGWIEGTLKKYEFTIDPLAISGSSAGVLTAKLSGSFPRSPVMLDFRYEIGDGRVSSLVIEPHGAA